MKYPFRFLIICWEKMTWERMEYYVSVYYLQHFSGGYVGPFFQKFTPNSVRESCIAALRRQHSALHNYKFYNIVIKSKKCRHLFRVVAHTISIHVLSLRGTVGGQIFAPRARDRELETRVCVCVCVCSSVFSFGWTLRCYACSKN